MTDTLHENLVALAATAALPALDLVAVERAARRRKIRARLLAGSVVIALAASGSILAVTAGGAPDRVTLQPADRPPAPVPTRAALEDALTRALPGSHIDSVDELGRAYLEPGTTAFAGRNRTGAVKAQVITPDGASLQLQWDGLDLPLDADEAAQIVDGITAVDHEGNQPPAQLLHEEPIVGGDVRAYRLHSPPNPKQSTLAVIAWSLNGTYATITRPSPPSDEGPALQQLLALARILVGRTGGGEDDSDALLCKKAIPAAEAVDADLRSGADPGAHLLELRDALEREGLKDPELVAAVHLMAAEVLPAASQVAKDPRVRINRDDFSDFSGRLAQLTRSCANVDRRR